MRPQDIKILGVTVTYNNEDKIPYVMPYYQRMGIDKLIVYDNDSTDRTVEMLSKYPFVEIRSYHTEQYSEDMVLKFKTDVQDEFRGLYDWCVSTYFDEVFYTERNFKEVLYEKMCDGKTVFMKTR
jgi:glycosyltransferase involved in cell wall biosynthesis